MKYIIDKRRFSEIIQKYITVVIGDEIEPHGSSNVRLWLNKEGLEIFKSYEKTQNLGVNKDLFRQIMEYFSLDGSESTRFMFQVFNEWFNNHQNFIYMSPGGTSKHLTIF